MKNPIAFVVLALVLVFSLTGCPDISRQVQAQTATTMAQAANSILPLMIEKYRQDGFKALEAVKAAGGTQEDAYAALDVVKARWASVWKAWESFKIAHDKWASVVEADGDYTAALAGLKEAYCELQAVWPEDMPALPVSIARCQP